MVDTREQNNGVGFEDTQTFNLPMFAQQGGVYGACTPFDLSAAQAYSMVARDANNIGTILRTKGT